MESQTKFSMLTDCSLNSLGVGVVAIILLTWFTALKSRALSSNIGSVIEPHDHHTAPLVPFVAIDKVDWKIIRRSLENYQLETKKTLEHLSMTLEVVELEEQHIFDSGWKLSSHIRAKISRLSDLYDHDLEVLERLLVPFPLVYALISSAARESHANVGARQESVYTVDNSVAALNSTAFNFTWYESPKLDPQQRIYDTVRQVVAHIVRDWSHTEGAPIRASIYDWCIDQLRVHKHTKNQGPVLVPGAGLGRLAWEISTHLDCPVEAMECSIFMAAAAHSILHRSVKNKFELHPFAADSFSNEILNEARYDKIKFPDIDVTHKRAGSLSFTIGRFDFESMQHSSRSHGAIVTSFFIDTTTTVYDIVNTVAMILVDDGLWINVGPLQWHINNQVPVSVDELRLIFENYCSKRAGNRVFEIIHWSVDQNPIPYRNNGIKHRSTHIDAYYPLRFVLRKRTR
jgi:N2227-like protein